jgi:hypothetical protein
MKTYGKQIYGRNYINYCFWFRPFYWYTPDDGSFNRWILNNRFKSDRFLSKLHTAMSLRHINRAAWEHNCHIGKLIYLNLEREIRKKHDWDFILKFLCTTHGFLL